MAKLTRETVVSEALDLLDEVGLDAVSTRRLAKRLGVEQPSLYWHFHNKEALLSAMAEAAMAPHHTAPMPAPSDDWRDWFIENSRSFRRTLLMRREGARLHAGSNPRGVGLSRAVEKLRFLVTAGLPERDAQMAMLAASHFTVGSVLEEQAADRDATADGDDPPFDHEEAFDAGLALIVDGLAARRRSERPTRTAGRQP
ncbi:TetR/AcrR family transcriptional regulator C-terminal domain-containing protein [Dactylosporangium sp. CA-233914]|uniref:TetR/AcrR family transcriptional regulator C-terminal domain-containing protein n=1 Tax=Dactylosporangium sp. CA-233914 TaxID=3239934 RepID=UPI003D89CEF3